MKSGVVTVNSSPLCETLSEDSETEPVPCKIQLRVSPSSLNSTVTSLASDSSASNVSLLQMLLLSVGVDPLSDIVNFAV